MPKPAVRNAIKLSKDRADLQTQLDENERQFGVTASDAVSQLGLLPGDSRLVKRLGETWLFTLSANGHLRVIPQTLDEDI